MLQKLETKTQDAREKEAFISEILGLFAKLQQQQTQSTSVHDELVKIKSKASTLNNSFVNQQLVDLYARLGIHQHHESSATPSTTTRKSVHRDSIHKSSNEKK